MTRVKKRPAVSKAVNMTPEQQRRQDKQVAWLEEAIAIQNRPASEPPPEWCSYCPNRRK